MFREGKILVLITFISGLFSTLYIYIVLYTFINGKEILPDVCFSYGVRKFKIPFWIHITESVN